MQQLSHLFPSITTYFNTITNNAHSFNVEDFCQGLPFQQMLKIMGIDCQFKHSSNFIESYQNLKAIHDIIIEEASKKSLYGIVEKEIDLMKIAKLQNIQQIIKLFLCCQSLALQGDNKEFFIEKMLTLQQSIQSELIFYLNPLMQKKQNNSSDKLILHKINELQHQNQQLQDIIIQQQNHSKQLNTKIKILNQRIIAYEQILESQQNSISSPKYPNEFSERKSLTPTRSIGDSIQRYQTQINSLQSELQIYKSNQAKLIGFKQKYEDYKRKYQDLLQATPKSDDKKEIDNLKVLLQDKQKKINAFQKHIKDLTTKNTQLHNINVKDSINIQLSNLKVANLQKQIQYYKQQKQQMQEIKINSLSEVCPEINHQIYELRQQNQNLLSNIQKTTQKIKALEKQLQRYKRQYHRLASLERENKKLQQILMEYSNARGQQNDILVGCLYQLRMKFMSQKLGLQKQGKENVSQFFGSRTKGRYD